MNTKIKQFRLIANIEGWSYLILLFIAMPLKYIMGIAIATKLIGMIHGGLFIWFLISLYNTTQEYKWGVKFTMFAFITSLVPFGTFFLDKKLAPIDTPIKETI